MPALLLRDRETGGVWIGIFPKASKSLMEEVSEGSIYEPLCPLPKNYVKIPRDVIGLESYGGEVFPLSKKEALDLLHEIELVLMVYPKYNLEEIRKVSTRILDNYRNVIDELCDELFGTT